MGSGSPVIPLRPSGVLAPRRRSLALLVGIAWLIVFVLATWLTTGHDLASKVVKVKGVDVLPLRLEGADSETLRNAADQYKSRYENAVVVLGSATDGKVMLVASVTPAISKIVSAGKLVGEIAQMVGGKGGGRPDFAQAGGNDPSKLDDALRAVPKLVADKLGGT